MSLLLGSGQQSPVGTWACTLQERCKIIPAFYKLSSLLRFSRGMESGECMCIKGDSVGWSIQDSLGLDQQCPASHHRGQEPGQYSAHGVGCFKQSQMVTEGLKDLGRPTGLQYTSGGRRRCILMSVKTGGSRVHELTARCETGDELTATRRQHRSVSPVGPPFIWLPLQGGALKFGVGHSISYNLTRKTPSRLGPWLISQLLPNGVKLTTKIN